MMHLYDCEVLVSFNVMRVPNYVVQAEISEAIVLLNDRSFIIWGHLVDHAHISHYFKGRIPTSKSIYEATNLINAKITALKTFSRFKVKSYQIKLYAPEVYLE